jgi:hypothetical protein
MTEKKKRKWPKRLAFSIIGVILLFIVVYFIKPSLIVDFFHIGIKRDEITLKTKELSPREKLINKWTELVAGQRESGTYPPFTFDSDELEIFVQETYRRSFPEEIKGLKLKLIDDYLFLRLKLNLEDYESEIKNYGSPQLAKMLKEDIVFTIKASVKRVYNDTVEVDIRSIRVGFLPLPMILVDKIINSPANVKKYNREFDYEKYPLPEGIRTLKIENSVLYVNH